ncbi:glutaredoxin domain-containing protein [Novosphingobium resinovorum]|uniref:Methylamine utilization protein MauE n=1 Tax=Novosphingobium resinovorum TaxID=158500 RepID=A0A031K7I6_9SPHN|nr:MULTISPECIES: MauE/DoxX family redox-associated membrane protein [Sphingomonadaceae]AOR75947.1 glutaredoxin [Novosphingobium resinovorum]EJU10755.1 glutaredoxin [Sphingomonas sp. LH128]EZP84958.1 Glutaredoxin [Novosphingobium resinovorum]MBF7011325.1 glutaredoxin [Novosphingobium sp. HR1a]WJM29307.1 glutaredoxin domain-containing protein [Novosphingobium resinovorum]
MSDHQAPARTAVLYRMVMEKHVCPYGLKARHLLKSRGYRVEDHWLTTRDEVDAFKAEYGVATTPQIFIDGERIGGHSDLKRFLGLDDQAKRMSYAPVLWVFGTAAAVALAASWASLGSPLTVHAAEWFVAITMMLLAMLKLQDIETFSSMFLGYDLLARRYVPYAYAYPFLEWFAGAFMAAGVLNWLSIPVALVIGGVGGASVFYAVYVQKRELKCACVGGSGSVPLGFVSLMENVFMVAMALWMLLKPMAMG